MAESHRFRVEAKELRNLGDELREFATG